MARVARTDSGAAWLSRRYRDAGVVVVRSPLLPFDDLVEWAAGCEARPGDDAAVHEARRSELGSRLLRLFARSELREALFLASPALERRLRKALEQGRLAAEFVPALTRYLTRMTTRETPFGAFAGISLGRVGDATRLMFVPRSAYRRRTRLGMGYFVRVLAGFWEREALRDEALYEPNSTLYRAFGRYRFAASAAAAGTGGGVAAPVVNVAATAHLERALVRAAGGATLAEIALGIEAPARPRTVRFVRTLVEREILVPAWRPPVTGPEPFDAASDALVARAPAAGEAERLRSIVRRVKESNALPLGSALPHLESLVEELGAAPDDRELAQRLHADLFKPGAQMTLDRATVQRMLHAAELLQRTASALPDPRLARFRQRFVDRYGERFVPLAEALDGDLGIGFDSLQRSANAHITADLNGEGKRPPIHFDAYDTARLRLLTRALQAGERIVELDDAALEEFPERGEGPLPDSFAIIAQLGLIEGRACVLGPQLSGPSGISLLSRFCHGDVELAAAVRAFAEQEAALAGDCVLADVAHLPSGHAADILLRPLLRTHEIVYGGKSGAPEDRQLYISDLLVGVVREQVMLWSRRLKRRVAIRIANAHDVDAWFHLPVYRFLGALANEDRAGLATAWSWGTLQNCAFLPRVVHGDVVLCRMRWTLDAERRLALRGASDDIVCARLRALRDDLGLPRWVAIVGRGSALTIDLDNRLSVDLLLKEARDAAPLQLEEVLPTPEQLLARGPEGAYVAEVVLPVSARRATRPAQVSPRWSSALDGSDALARSFPPGSEWLYIKIFCGPSQIVPSLHAVMNELERAGLDSMIDRWFFLPFADPEPHLRLRFRGSGDVLLGRVLPTVHQALAGALRERSVWRVQVDTYERELERYGGPTGMELAEELFCVDSDAVRLLLELSANDEQLRWQLALVGVDRLWSDLGLDLPTRARLVSGTAAGLRKELGVSAPIGGVLGVKYRTCAAQLGELLWSMAKDESSAQGRGDAILRSRSERSRSIVARLLEAARRGELTAPIDELAVSFAHVFVVRLLGLEARLHEVVIHDFLKRQYLSRLISARLSGRVGPAEAAQ
jgi:thiopeptide-type bacteriocin biosynthesis protein